MIIIDPYDRVMAKAEWDDNECLVFTRSTNHDGYGRIGIGSRTDSTRKNTFAHKVVWEHHYGPVPEGMMVCHTCDNPPCVDIDHLFLGTMADNMRDMSQKGRGWNQKKTHCPAGHEYTPENTYRSSTDGKRRCRQCRSGQS